MHGPFVPKRPRRAKPDGRPSGVLIGVFSSPSGRGIRRRRAPPPEVDEGDAGQAGAGLQEGRRRHRRQRLGHLRRRGGVYPGHARLRRRAGTRADRPPGVMGSCRGSARDHGDRSGPGGAPGAGARRNDAGPDGPGRGERGFRGAVPRGGTGARSRPGPDQRGRRCHGIRWERAGPGSRSTCCTPSVVSARSTAWGAPASAAARASL